MFTVSGGGRGLRGRGAECSLSVGEWGRRGAECSLSVGEGGLSVHCQWGRGAECSLSVGEGG